MHKRLILLLAVVATHTRGTAKQTPQAPRNFIIYIAYGELVRFKPTHLDKTNQLYASPGSLKAADYPPR